MHMIVIEIIELKHRTNIELHVTGIGQWQRAQPCSIVYSRVLLPFQL